MAHKSPAKKDGAKPGLQKTRTGINGLDEITEGGIPAGRPTLVCGGAGCGKSLLSAEFIVRGATEFNEPGVLMSFEEKAQEIMVNVESLGFDLTTLQQENKVRVDYVHIERAEIEETGEYDLEGLFIRLGYAIDSIGAKRVVLDTIENLFSGLQNVGILRAELRRLFQWLKDKKVTAMITAEKGEGTLTRQGLEEYVSDCVIVLDHRVVNQVSTRFLRVIKYRGSVHGTNEYPFLIDKDGISVLPITSLRLGNDVSSERISSGFKALDKMLGGEGFFRGSSVLVSGSAGVGKTSIVACFANACCLRKERCIYFAFEESPQQIVRNMQSININLQAHVDKGYLQFQAARPTLNGLEMHLVRIHKAIKQFKPSMIILDPISNFVTVGSVSEVKTFLIRLIDFLQAEQITAVFTALTLNTSANEQIDEGVSSLVDAWLLASYIELNGERNRGLYIMKSRGMYHSNQVREFVIASTGLDLEDVYISNNGVLTGSARKQHELNQQTGELLRTHALTRKDREIERKRNVLQAKIETLKEEFETVQDELNKSFIEEELRKELIEKNGPTPDIEAGNITKQKTKNKQ